MDTDVIILCGGKGKRLRSVLNDRPKPMAKVRDRPFLDILITYLMGFGFKRFILCIGYMGDFIKEYYIDKKEPEIIFSEENEPLGTAGAIKNAMPLIKSSSFFILNGDSFVGIDFRKFLIFHLNKNALISMVIKKVSSSNHSGVVKMNTLNQVVAFNENIKKINSCYINTGIYIFNKEVLSLMSKTKEFSLEKDFFSFVIKKRLMYGYLTRGAFIDIGTPKSYKYANVFFRRYKKTGLAAFC